MKNPYTYLSIIILLSLSSITEAAQDNWMGYTDDDWFNAANWGEYRVPNEHDDSQIEKGDHNPIIKTGTAYVNGLWVGYDGTSSLSIGGENSQATLNANELYVMEAKMPIKKNGLVNASLVMVGFMSDPGSVVYSSLIMEGDRDGKAKLNVSGTLMVSYGRQLSEMDISKDSEVTVGGDMYIGKMSNYYTGTGIVKVSGEDNEKGTLTVKNNLIIGDGSLGVPVYQQLKNSGTMFVSTNGDVTVEKDVVIGRASDKRLESEGCLSMDGGSLTAQDMLIGDNNGHGILTVNSGTLSISGTIGLGRSGTAEMYVKGGQVTTGDIDFGTTDNSYGWLVLSGGRLTVPGIHAHGQDGQVFQFSGGILQATQSTENFIDGFKDGYFQLIGSGTIDTQNYSVTIPSLVQGWGTLIKTGPGTLVLRGTNTYSGGSIVNTGTLIGDTYSLQGGIKVEKGADLVINQSWSGTFNGNVSDEGTMTINNSKKEDTITFNKDQAHVGDTIIEKGTMELNSKTDSANVRIQQEGILTGTGTVSHNVVNDGVFRPVIVPGYITYVAINNDYTQKENGILEIPMYNNQFGKVEVKGMINIDEKSKVNFQLHDVTPEGEYKFIKGDQGRDGTFGYALIDGLDSTQTEYIVTFKEYSDEIGAIFSHRGFQKAGTNFVQRSVGKALDEMIENAGPNGLYVSDQAVKRAAQERMSDIPYGDQTDSEKARTNKGGGALAQYICDLEGLPYQKLGTYLQQISPDLAASIKDIAFNATNMQYGQVTQRLADIRSGTNGMSLNGLSSEPMQQQSSQHEESLHDKDGKTVAYKEAATAYHEQKQSPWSIFATASGIFSNIASPNDMPRQHVMTGYFTTGADYRFNEHYNAGIYVGYQGMESRYSGSVLRSNGLKFGMYGTGEWHGFYVNAMLGGGDSAYSLHRTISTQYHSWAVASSPNGAELDSLLGIGYEFNLGHWRFGTNASMQYTYLGISSFTESGAGSLDVKGEGQNPSSLMSTVGANISYEWQIGPSVRIMPTIGLSWQHEFLNYGQNISGAFDNGSGTGFTFASMDGDRDQAYGTAGVSAQIGQHFGGYVYYNPVFGGKQISSQGILVGLNYNF